MRAYKSFDNPKKKRSRTSSPTGAAGKGPRGGIAHGFHDDRPDDLAGAGDPPMESVRDLVRLADHGSAAAAFIVSRLYEEGNIVPPSEKLALHYLFAAAERGDVRAQRDLAQLYIVGHLVPRPDLRKSLYWIGMAEKGGAADAWYDLAKSLEDGGSESRDIRLYLYLLRKAAHGGCEEAMIDLAKLHLKGRYVRRSTPAAWRFLLMALYNPTANALLEVLSEGDS